MRILHVIASVDPHGGGPIEGIKQRGAWLIQQGHQVEVASLDDPTAPCVHNFPLPVHALGPSWGVYGYSTRLRPWLRQRLAHFDHVVVSGLWQFHGWAVMHESTAQGRGYHVFVHGMLDPWFNEAYPFKRLKKLIYWRIAEHHVVARATKVLFTSEVERQRARRSFRPYTVRESVVAYGTRPPPQDKAAYRARFHDAHIGLSGCHLLLFLGRLHEKKGCDLLLQAFAAIARDHPKARLLIAGSGEMEVPLRALADRLGIAHLVVWLGMVQGDAKWAAFHAADVFVLPSHQENFGIAVAEALGCGLPVLISDRVNICHEVEASGAGFVAPDTLEGTKNNLVRWLSMPLALRAGMSHAARLSFAARFSVEAMGKSLLDVLQQRDN